MKIDCPTFFLPIMVKGLYEKHNDINFRMSEYYRVIGHKSYISNFDNLSLRFNAKISLFTRLIRIYGLIESIEGNFC